MNRVKYNLDEHRRVLQVVDISDSERLVKVQKLGWAFNAFKDRLAFFIYSARLYWAMWINNKQNTRAIVYSKF